MDNSLAVWLKIRLKTGLWVNPIPGRSAETYKANSQELSKNQLMLYILNSVLKDNKNCTISLPACFGLGVALSKQICDLLGFSKNVKLSQLSASQRLRLVECISQNYQIAAQLRSDIKKHKARLISIRPSV